jgi:hypothetical protein
VPVPDEGRLPIPGVGWIALFLAGVTFAFFFAIPTFPSYDGYYSLLWAREIAAGSLPVFETPAAPTEHPLAILIGLLTLPLGDGAERAYVLVGLLSFAALAAAIYALGAELFNRTVGVLAALIVLTRFDLAALAVRGFVDIPFLALVIWSAVFVAREPRRVQPVVFVLLTIAGLLRPEAWLFAGVYWLYCARMLDWPGRLRYALVVGIAPLVWLGVDWIVTGNPLYSLTATRELAAELERNRGFFSVLFDLPVLIARTVKMSVLLAGLAGIGLGLYCWRERMYVPLATAAVGLGTFLTTTALGLAVNLRYLSTVSVIVCLGAGLALGGWTVPSVRGRGLAIGVAVLAAALLVARLPSLYDSYEIERDKVLYVDSQHDKLVAVLEAGGARGELERCGAMTVPSHQNVPVVRYLVDAEAAQVTASSYQQTQPTRGLVLTANVPLADVNPGPGGRDNWWATRVTDDFELLAENAAWRLYAKDCGVGARSAG